MARAWMPMYWGDYLRDTADLSLVEHGAYVKLLSTYYSTGKPLPANAKQLLRICSAFDEAEQQAMQVVLDRFFVKAGDVYRNKRADAEIAKAIEVSEKRAEAGVLGAKAKAKANAKANAGANADTTTATTTTTSTSTKDVSRKRLMPADFTLDDGLRLYATNRWLDPDEQFEKFSLHHRAKGSKFSDWRAAFQKWCVKAAEFAEKDKPRGGLGVLE